MKLKTLIAAACLGAHCSMALATDGKVKVGMITTLSGGGAGLGIDVRDGFMLAAKMAGTTIWKSWSRTISASPRLPCNWPTR